MASVGGREPVLLRRLYKVLTSAAAARTGRGPDGVVEHHGDHRALLQPARVGVVSRAGRRRLRARVRVAARGFVTTFLGNVFLFRAVQRDNCPSLIIFSMAMILIISTVGMSIESIRTLSSS